MINKIPGTILAFSEGNQVNTFDVIEPVFAFTKGLTLAQIREFTGLESSTIQNWVKRGWVAHPVEKRYGRQQAVRIILINSIRGAIQLEKIPMLMEYINGVVEDESDDIISDVDLFNTFCHIVWECDKSTSFDKSAISQVIQEHLKTYKGPEADSKTKLSNALLIMVLAYFSAQLKNNAEEEFCKIIQNPTEANNTDL